MNAWIQGAMLAGLSLGCLTSAAPAAERAAESPQSLAVVAVAAPVPLTCAGAECTAELSTICLEEQQGAPAPGTSYRAVAVAPGGLASGELVPGGLVLVGRRPDGTMARLPADGLVTVTAARTYAAVRVALPTARLAGLGLDGPALAVEGEVALVPGPDGIDLARRAAVPALRHLATTVLAGESTTAGAAALTARLIGALPAQGRTAPEAAAVLWRRMVGAAGLGGVSGAGQARAILERCMDETALAETTLRQCLESRHDSLIGRLTRATWRAVRADS